MEKTTGIEESWCPVQDHGKSKALLPILMHTQQLLQGKTRPRVQSPVKLIPTWEQRLQRPGNGEQAAEGPEWCPPPLMLDFHNRLRSPLWSFPSLDT